jgi:hypothetical protein
MYNFYDAGSNTISDVVVTALGIRKDERKIGYLGYHRNGDQLTRARETNIANSLGRPGSPVLSVKEVQTTAAPVRTIQNCCYVGLPSMNSAGSPLLCY